MCGLSKASPPARSMPWGNDPQTPGRKITKCILVVTPLTFWACDWSIHPVETLLREYLPSRGKIVKYWPVRGYKRVWDHCFSVYLSNSYCRYKTFFGTPIAFSVMCSLWKIGSILLDLLQIFVTKSDFKLWWFHERSHSSTNKNSHFLGLEKVITFVWYPTIVAEKLGYLNKWRLLPPPLFYSPHKRLVWIRHCYVLHSFWSSKT